MAPLSGLQHAWVVAQTLAVGTIDTTFNVLENLADRLGWGLAPKLPQDPLNGKVCIITGGNAGIGLATAELLAARGAHVILACRSRERGQAAAAAIQKKVQPLPGCGKPVVEVMQVDMASLKSVRQFCSAFNARRQPLHLLVANAGIMSPATRLHTEDNLEMQFQVNFLSHWLIVHSLLAEQRVRRATAKQRKGHKEAAPALNGLPRAPLTLTAASGSSAAALAEPAAFGSITTQQQHGSAREARRFAGWGLREDGTRVVMVSSLTHFCGILNWKDMQSEAHYDPFTSYGLSKLANAMTARELHQRLERHASTQEGQAWGADSVTSVHPGVVDTYLANNFFKNQGPAAIWPAAQPVVAAVVDALRPIMMKTTANSAAVMGVAALAPAHMVGGKYLVNGHVAPSAPAVQDSGLAQQLWDTAQRLTGLTPHRSLA